MKLPTDDYMAQWAQPFWGTPGRDDLSAIRAMCLASVLLFKSVQGRCQLLECSQAAPLVSVAEEHRYLTTLWQRSPLESQALPEPSL